MSSSLGFSIYVFRMLKHFYRAKAISPETAVTLESINIRKTPIFNRCVNLNWFIEVSDGYYYLNINEVKRRKILWLIITS